MNWAIYKLIPYSLWEMGSKIPTPLFQLQPPANPLVALLSDPGSSSSNTTSLSSQLQSASITPQSQSTPSNFNGDPASVGRELLTPEEVSTLLNLALYQALSTSPPTSFPIPASTLYSGYILPNRPAYIPQDQREDVVIGKSDWKKLGKWMKELGKEGVLKIKENKGDVTVVR